MKKNLFLKFIKIFLLASIAFFGINWFVSYVLDININTFLEKRSKTDSTQNKSSSPLYREGQNLRPIRVQNSNVPSLFSLQQAYNDVAEQAINAVVSLQVESQTATENPFGNDEFLRRFFGIPNNPQGRRRESFGSGFVISSDGFLLSNFHVIKNATKIEIVFKNSNKKYTASVVGSDQDTDIALLKIDSNKDFPFLKLANSEQVKIGDIVIAIGNPFGLSHTFTTGVISAKGRTGVIGNRYENFIQTDVAINPGNSGGPLLNLYGEVIGINSAILSRSGGSIGIGFSIPINMAKNILDELKTKGKVARGWIGINFEEISEDLAQALDISSSDGIVITRIIENSPAAKGNIKAGDILVRFNGQKIKNGQDLINKLGNIKVGKRVSLTLLRDGRTVKTRITILERNDTAFNNSPSNPPNSTKNLDKYFGITVVEMDLKTLKKYNLRKSIGVQVVSISRSSPLINKGLKVGDIIKSINKKPTTSLISYKKIAKSVKGGQKTLFTIQRGKGVFYLVITL